MCCLQVGMEKVTRGEGDARDENDYTALLLAAETGAIVLLALPIPFPFGSAAHSCASVILPATQAVAQELSLATIDLYSPFRDQADKFTDADHLTDDAIDLLASSVAAAVSASRPKL